MAMSTLDDHPARKSHHRELARQLAIASAAMDRALYGDPVFPAYTINYKLQQRRLESRAKDQLRIVFEMLQSMNLG